MCVKQNQHKTNQQGAVMLFALLILSVMAAIGFVLSSLVYREATVARSFDDSLHAFYAAESGIERGLDILSEHRKDHDDLATTVTAIESYATDASPVTLSTSNATYVVDSSATTTSSSSLHVPIEGFFQIELYDPDNSISTLMTAESMQLWWNLPSSCSATSQVEFTFQEFNSGSVGLADDSVYKQVYTCGVETPPSGYDCQATSNWPSTNNNYIIQVGTLDCGRIDATITLYDADNATGNEVDIPSLVNVAVRGEGELSQREMTAHTKWIPSASGLGEFVLFSIEAIAK